jgi:hypothetical protein
VRYWMGVRATFARDLRQFVDKHAAVGRVKEPMAATAPTLPRVKRLIAKPTEHPKHMPPMKLPAGWQGTSLNERLVRYWKEVRASFARDWKQFVVQMDRRG